MLEGMTRSLTSATRTVLSVTSSAARHAAWYLRYQVDGTARARRQRPRPKRTTER